MKSNIDKHQITTSIILPSYNSSDIITNRVPDLIAYLDGLRTSYEIIIVDDGSSDNERTKSIANQLNCKYIHNKNNLGKGGAVRRGMLLAKGKYRIFTDIDIPYDFLSIEKFLWYLDNKEFHIVAGDRTLPESEYYEKIPPIKRIRRQILSSLSGRLFVGGWYDTQCGIKGFRDYVATDLFSVSRINGFAFDIEIIYLALKRNYDIKRLPVKLVYQGKSSVKVTYHGMTILRDIFIIRSHQFLNHYQPKSQLIRTIDSYPENYYKRHATKSKDR